MSRPGIPVTFQTMNPEDARKALEGFSDELASEHKRAEAIYRQHQLCPNGCGPTMEKHGAGPSFAFSDPNWSIPRCLMKCHVCGCVRNPFDGMIVELGDTKKARYGDVRFIDPSKG